MRQNAYYQCCQLTSTLLHQNILKSRPDSANFFTNIFYLDFFRHISLINQIAYVSYIECMILHLWFHWLLVYKVK